MVDSVGDQTASRDKLGKWINRRNVKSRRLGQPGVNPGVTGANRPTGSYFGGLFGLLQAAAASVDEDHA
jgi:hypothetical protein